jgi:hypothetical protein
LLIALAAAEFVGDKVPAVDSVVQVIQWPLAAVAGAIAFASQTQAVTWVRPELALLVGLLTATGVHGARTVARPLVTGATFGAGNSAVSLAEDAYAVTLAGASLVAPALALVLFLALAGAAVIVVVWVVRRGRRLHRRVFGRSPSVVPAAPAAPAGARG